MSVSALQEFTNQLAEFGNGLDKLHRMMGDANEANAPILVEEIHAESLAVIGLQVAVLEAARQAQRAMEEDKDRERARHQLGRCNQSFIEMIARFYERLYTTEHMLNLEKLKRKPGGEWARIAMNDLYSSRQSIQDVSSLLLNSWETLAESMAVHSTSVQTTSIGQQFLIPERSK